MIEFVSASQAPTATSDEVRALVRLVQLDVPGFALGPEYEHFILNSNPGAPRNRFFRVGEELAPPVDRFLNLAPSGGPHAPFNINNVLDAIEDRLPAGVVPFACLSNGDYLCLVSNGHGSTTVSMTAFENSEVEAKLRPVAPSFSAFLTLLISRANV